LSLGTELARDFWCSKDPNGPVNHFVAGRSRSTLPLILNNL